MKRHTKILLHAGILAGAAGWLCENRTFYGVLVKVATNNFLHLLHTTFIIHILLAVTSALTCHAVGNLSESETAIYNERVYSMFGELVMIISFFPSDLEIVSILYFSMLFAVKSFAWSFSIKAQRYYSKTMALCGLGALLVAAAASAVCWLTLGHRFSINILFALEYSLVVLDLSRTLFIMAVDLLEIERSRSVYVFCSAILFYVVRCVAYAIFIVVVSLHQRFPVNAARSLIASLMKLRKKIILFKAYLRLCADLDAIADAAVDTTCAICQDPLTVGKMLRCRHTFHGDCLKTWCERETSCPICRAELVFHREETLTTEDEILTGIPVDVNE